MDGTGESPQKSPKTAAEARADGNAETPPPGQASASRPSSSQVRCSCETTSTAGRASASRRYPCRWGTPSTLPAEATPSSWAATGGSPARGWMREGSFLLLLLGRELSQASLHVGSSRWTDTAGGCPEAGRPPWSSSPSLAHLNLSRLSMLIFQDHLSGILALSIWHRKTGRRHTLQWMSCPANPHSRLGSNVENKIWDGARG